MRVAGAWRSCLIHNCVVPGEDLASDFRPPFIAPGDMEASLLRPPPRLRISRHPPDTVSTPVAGPSRLSPQMNTHENNEDDEDAESTPRMPSASMDVEKTSPHTAASTPLPADTPAARLRALLARFPNTSTTPHASSSRLPEPATPSEPDSDLDPPYSTLATPSIARESLKELFSHALRDPGNTPQKGRARRNSIGTGEVGPSPRIERVEKERAKNKGKRRSMSDEEADHLSSASKPTFISPDVDHTLASRCLAAVRRILSIVTRSDLRRVAGTPCKIAVYAPDSSSRSDGTRYVHAAF